MSEQDDRHIIPINEHEEKKKGRVTATTATTATVPGMLRQLASVYEARGASYSDNYKHAGEVLLGLFPRGLTVRTAEEFNRLHLIVHMASKLSRYAMMMQRGGHDDSLVDLAVYATMLRECDLEGVGRGLEAEDQA